MKVEFYKIEYLFIIIKKKSACNTLLRDFFSLILLIVVPPTKLPLPRFGLGLGSGWTPKPPKL